MADRQQTLTSIFTTVGDFRPNQDALEAAEEQMGERTARSQRQDRSKRAPVTTDYSKWKSNTDHWDYPGVDTPREDPRVLPKDLKVKEKPRTTDPNTGESRAARKESRPPGASENFFEQQQLSSTDISLAPEEAFKGTQANDPQALGGFLFDAHKEEPRETDRPGQEQVPPDIAAPEPVPDAPQSDKGLWFQKVSDKTKPGEFKKKVRRKKREMSGLADDWAAAGLVADNLQIE